MANEKQQLIDELKALLEQDGTAQKEQVEQLKNQFYRQYHQELEALRLEAQQAAEGDEASMETWQPPVDEQEQEFRELLSQYKKQRAEAAARQEAEMLALEARTLDHVSPGEQQPETDHKIQSQRSNTGVTRDVHYRDARSGGVGAASVAPDDERSVRDGYLFSFSARDDETRLFILCHFVFSRP